MPVDLLTLSRHVGAELIDKKASVCAAESCTGGLLLSALTDIAGSSAYVQGGLVTYSNEAKMRFLKVREATLIEHGAVSEATAGEMARGALALFGTRLRAERDRHRGSWRRHSRETGRLDLSLVWRPAMAIYEWSGMYGLATASRTNAPASRRRCGCCWTR